MVTRRCLKTGGFTEDEAGMEAALLSGWAHVNYPQGQEMTLLTVRRPGIIGAGSKRWFPSVLRSSCWAAGAAGNGEKG